eukprot:2118921-Amphidinium_carterae.1
MIREVAKNELQAWLLWSKSENARWTDKHGWFHWGGRLTSPFCLEAYTIHACGYSVPAGALPPNIMAEIQEFSKTIRDIQGAEMEIYALKDVPTSIQLSFSENANEKARRALMCFGCVSNGVQSAVAGAYADAHAAVLVEPKSAFGVRAAAVNTTIVYDRNHQPQVNSFFPLALEVNGMHRVYRDAATNTDAERL